MKGYYIKNKRKYVGYISLFFLFTILISFFSYDFEALKTPQNFLYAIGCFIAWIGISFGLLASLGTSLIVIFLYGTYLLWQAITIDLITFDVKGSIIWMIVWLMSSVVTGVLHQFVVSILEENDNMNQKFDDLVSIDEHTGFDNQKRFFFELEEEYKRSERVKAPFSLLLIKIEYFDQFMSLYGQKETIYFLNEFSKKMYESTRISDKKFRLEEDLYALILPYTVGEENINTVTSKIEKNLKTHILLKEKKQVTITFSFGHASYSQELGNQMELYDNAVRELERYIR